MYGVFVCFYDVSHEINNLWNRENIVFDKLCSGLCLDIREYRHGIICENCLKFMTFLKKIKYLRNRRNLCIFIYIIYSMFLLDIIKYICFVFYDVYQRNPGSFETKKTIVNSCYFYFSYILTCILYDILWSISCEA